MIGGAYELAIGSTSRILLVQLNVINGVPVPPRHMHNQQVSPRPHRHALLLYFANSLLRRASVAYTHLLTPCKPVTRCLVSATAVILPPTLDMSEHMPEWDAPGMSRRASALGNVLDIRCYSRADNASLGQLSLATSQARRN